MPEIAVVIPTRGRETRLAFALDALAQQTLDRNRFEVIVARAADESEALAEAPNGLRVRFIDCALAGTAAQRNRGWRASEAPLIAFTDDDCRPAPNWLESLLEPGVAPNTILQGRTVPDPDESHLLKGGIARTINVSGPTGWYQTCNIAYPRGMLERLGGFDEAFEFLGEDTDLGLRARAGGARLRFVQEAVVWHAVYWRNVAHALRDIYRRRSMPGLVARYPEQRRALWLGVFTSPDHIRLLVAVAGLLAVRRVPLLAMLAAVPYTKRSFSARGLTPWRALRFPALVLSRAAVDGAEMLVFAAASVRHRTLVL